MNLARMGRPADSVAGYKKDPAQGRVSLKGENVMLPQGAAALYHFLRALPASLSAMAKACFSDFTIGPFLLPE